MKRTLAVFIVSVALLTACDRKDLVVWSPDGKRVAIVASDGLRMGDDTGTLGAPVLANAKFCRWLPDSFHVIVASRKATTNWHELKDLLSASEQKIIIRMAEKVWNTRSLAPTKASPDGHRQAKAIQYLMNAHGAQATKLRLHKLLREYGSSFGSVDIDTIQSVDISGTDQVSKRLLWRTAQSISDMRVSHNGKMIAVCIETDPTYKIILIPAQGGKPTTAVDSLADSVDWSIDGKSLFYVSYSPIDEHKPVGKLDDTDSHPFLASINNLIVADAEGNVLPKFAPPMKLADIFAADGCRVRCLPGGSIVFYAKQRTYPSISTSSEPHSCLFRLSSDFKTIEPINGSAELPDDAMHNFEPNQDGTKIVVAGSHGEIAVLDLISGKVATLEATGKQDLRFSPQWRTSDELSYPSRNAVGRTTNHDIDVVLQFVSNPGQRRVLSNEWSPTSVNFLQDPKDSPSQRQMSPFKKKAILNTDSKQQIRNLKSEIGKEVTVVGTFSLRGKVAPFVKLDYLPNPIYLSENWHSIANGSTIEVSGKLEYFFGFDSGSDSIASTPAYFYFKHPQIKVQHIGPVPGHGGTRQNEQRAIY